MKIKSLEISNWRSIKSLQLELQDLAIFIGQNNNGKSNILNALLFFFGEIKHTEHDFNDCDTELYVEITFCCLDEFDQNQFQKYVTASGEIKVRKVAQKGSAADLYGYLELPRDVNLREDAMSGFTTAEKRSELPFADQLPAGRITQDQLKSYLAAHIEANRAAIPMEYQLETTPFFGARGIGQSMFGEILYIPAVTVAASELAVKGSSMFNKLYSRVATKISETNPLYRQASAALAALVSSMNRTNPDGSPNTERPEELTRLEELIGAQMEAWKSKLEIEFTAPHVEDAVKLETSVMVFDGKKTDIDRKGNGLQRSLVFALIKAWAVIMKEEREKRRADAGEDGPKRGASHSTYFIFEEPELFLHPQAQRELFTSLKELSQADNQVFLTTHSSSFVNLEDHKSIVIVHKNDFEEGTTIVQCNDDLYHEEDARKLFGLQLLINPERSESFFAKKVVIVEGPTDKAVIPFLAKSLNIFKHEYSFIEASGKEGIPLYIHLFNCFKIKYVVVYDKDHQAHKTPAQLEGATASSQLIEDKIDATYGTSILFDNDIEEEIAFIPSRSKYKPFEALKHVSATGYTIPTQLEQKLRAIYA
ncbi:ATP-dependent nuclease [Hymenobacter psychrotolerans]|uniref:CRISPR-associated exonuclease Cas4 n=1 Tax=Hymenobacter psychrotolerans DSM 18569 TaxID=1121959 RepID=A0A1M7EWW1_9BACT|nr:AAA family ATPase [Hymenobacter psychrotolerans]SHL96304.1 CRISPR-associated exonuclease Cas4 [Hymenobacter psychrotolerans DSM 18569]